MALIERLLNWSQLKRRKFSQFSLYCRQLYAYSYLDISTKMLVQSDPEFGEFFQKHPFVVRAVKQSVKFVSFTQSVVEFLKFRGFWDQLLSGPRKVSIQTLNRRHWSDPDRVMLHAAFQILVDFVEIELPLCAPQETFDSLGIKSKSGRRYPEVAIEYLKANNYNYNSDILNLYLWWTTVACYQDGSYEPKVEVDRSNEVSWARVSLHTNYANFVRAQEEEMLTRLVKIRTDLWT